jgi:hypothetical protein
MNITFTLPLNDAEVRAESQKLINEITKRNAEIKMLSAALKAVRELCQHSHPKQGYDQRDGSSWASPCIHCGHSY